MTVRKFLTQSDSVKMRHAPQLVMAYELEVCAEPGPVPQIREYSPDLLRLLSSLDTEPWLDDRTRAALTAALRLLAMPNGNTDRDQVCRALNHLRHELLLLSGRASADWDSGACTTATESGRSDGDGGCARRFPIGLYGESIRSPFNVGSIIRSAEAFGAAFCAFSADSAPPDHPRARRSAMGSAEYLPVEIVDLEGLLKRGWSLFALELGGSPVSRFAFPEHAVAVLGNEELGVSQRAMQLARESAGIVSIPLFGHKASLNVATASAALLSWWTAALDKR